MRTKLSRTSMRRIRTRRRIKKLIKVQQQPHNCVKRRRKIPKTWNVWETCREVLEKMKFSDMEYKKLRNYLSRKINLKYKTKKMMKRKRKHRVILTAHLALWDPRFQAKVIKKVFRYLHLKFTAEPSYCIGWGLEIEFAGKLLYLAGVRRDPSVRKARN